ncbi:MAG: glycosyltransferase family 2 protein [Syntrophaceae bacterium]|nr:glycosyltransferase family 2 protein [Syntrophaceae bacterium]
MQTTIIIPCYNEEKRLPINAFLNYVKSNKNVRFLFVNDGSKDNTADVLKYLRNQNECFLTLDLQKNSGKSEAVRQGMLYAVKNLDFDYIGFWDADLSTPLNEIEPFIDCFQKNNYQIVMGCRLMRLGASVKRKKIRHYLGRFFATAASIVLNLPVYDTQCGAKLYKANIVSLLFDNPFISRWLFDVELLARYIKIFGLEDAIRNIYEYPLSSWQDIAGSSIKIKDFLKAPIELWKIKRKYLT